MIRYGGVRTIDGMRMHLVSVWGHSEDGRPVAASPVDLPRGSP